MTGNIYQLESIARKKITVIKKKTPEGKRKRNRDNSEFDQRNRVYIYKESTETDTQTVTIGGIVGLLAVNGEI